MPDNEFTKLAIRYPVGFAIVNGIIIAAVGGINGAGLFSVVLGVAMTVGIYWLWRPGGAFRRREVRNLSSTKIDPKRLIATIVLAIVIFAITVLVMSQILGG